MKKWTLIAAAFAFLSPAATLAQSTAKPDESKMLSKTATISGKVSDDATTITDDKNVRWTIANPVMVEPFAGQTATVKGHPFKGENKIQVLAASGVTPDKQVAKRDDSAFRR